MTSVSSSLRGVFALCLAMLAVTAVAVPPGTPDEIRERLQPVGSVCRTGDDCGVASAAVAAGSGAAKSGEEVYNSFCFACHATGVGGAPLLDDAPAWAERANKGMDALWSSMKNGLNAMPPMGTCMACSDDELRAAMNFVLDSGK